MLVDFTPFYASYRMEVLQINRENTWKSKKFCRLYVEKLAFAGGLKQYSLRVTQTCCNISYSLAVHIVRVFDIWRE